jgi:phosphoglucosamine mutase
MTRLFGTDGVRGVANADLSPELAFRLGEAAGHFLGTSGRGRIVIGRDTRRSGNMLEAALVAGVCSGGADALVCRIVPTPAVAFLTRELEADGGVVISASHNPPEYNGIKLFDREGFKLPDEVEDEISDFIDTERDWERPIGEEVGRVIHVEDAVDRYVEHAAQAAAGDLSGLHVVVDCGHGAASVTTPEALRRLGATVTVLNCDWTGSDINVACGSTHLEPLRAAVLENGADVGLAHDGDADRVLAVDELGHEVDGDEIMAMCALDMQAKGQLEGDSIVVTVMSNLGLETALRDHGIRVVKTKVGDRYVLDGMRIGGASLGGEQSGHIIFMEHGTTGDGLVTGLKLCATLRDAGKPLSEVRSVMRRFPQVLLNVEVADKGRLGTSAVVTDAIHEAEEELGERGRVLVRASGTEPLVRVMVEAEEEPVAQAVASRLVQVVRDELG